MPTSGEGAEQILLQLCSHAGWQKVSTLPNLHVTAARSDTHLKRTAGDTGQGWKRRNPAILIFLHRSISHEPIHILPSTQSCPKGEWRNILLWGGTEYLKMTLAKNICSVLMGAKKKRRKKKEYYFLFWVPRSIKDLQRRLRKIAWEEHRFLMDYESLINDLWLLKSRAIKNRLFAHKCYSGLTKVINKDEQKWWTV